MSNQTLPLVAPAVGISGIPEIPGFLSTLDTARIIRDANTHPVRPWVFIGNMRLGSYRLTDQGVTELPFMGEMVTAGSGIEGWQLMKFPYNSWPGPYGYTVEERLAVKFSILPANLAPTLWTTYVRLGMIETDESGFGIGVQDDIFFRGRVGFSLRADLPTLNNSNYPYDQVSSAGEGNMMYPSVVLGPGTAASVNFGFSPEFDGGIIYPSYAEWLVNKVVKTPGVVQTGSFNGDITGLVLPGQMVSKDSRDPMSTVYDWFFEGQVFASPNTILRCLVPI